MQKCATSACMYFDELNLHTAYLLDINQTSTFLIASFPTVSLVSLALSRSALLN